MQARLDLKGQRFGRLTVIQTLPNRGSRTMWLCQCDCGLFAQSKTVALMRKVRPVRSCGCLVAIRTREVNLKHGFKNSGTYSSWTAMKNRCHCETSKDYPRYGAKGIKVCSRWHTFENFLHDMGERPIGKSIDRFPNKNGDYEPGNCRWATPKQQANNRNSPRRN